MSKTSEILQGQVFKKKKDDELYDFQEKNYRATNWNLQLVFVCKKKKSAITCGSFKQKG